MMIMKKMMVMMKVMSICTRLQIKSNSEMSKNRFQVFSAMLADQKKCFQDKKAVPNADRRGTVEPTTLYSKFFFGSTNTKYKLKQTFCHLSNTKYKKKHYLKNTKYKKNQRLHGQLSFCQHGNTKDWRGQNNQLGQNHQQLYQECFPKLNRAQVSTILITFDIVTKIVNKLFKL